MLPELKKVVNLSTISTANLPRVASLQRVRSVTPKSMKPAQERDRWEEAAKVFEPGLDRELGAGRESPGPQQYSMHSSIIGNTNQIDGRIRAPKRFSMAKAKRELSWA